MSNNALWNHVFVGGGCYIQSDGCKNYHGFAVEQYRKPKTIDAAKYYIEPEDENRLIVFTNPSGCLVGLAQSTLTGNFPSGFRVHLENASAGSASWPYGAVTVTPTTSTIDGLATFTIMPRCTVELVADGVNYRTERGHPPSGIITWTAASIALNPTQHGKLLVYTGNSDTDVTGDGVSTLLGFRVGIRNASDYVVRFIRWGGGYDYIPPGQAYDLYVPDDNDSGTTNYAMTGITMFGATPRGAADYTLLRSDQGRVIEFTGSADRALTGFVITADDGIFAFAIKNNTTSKTVTFTPGGGQKVNGANSLTLSSCEGVWVFADSIGLKWIAVTGKMCVAGAKIYNGSTQTITAGATATLTVSAAENDPQSYRSGDTFVIPAGLAGVYELNYEFDATVAFSGSLTITPTTIESWIELNNAEVRGTHDCGYVERLSVGPTTSGTTTSTIIDHIHLCLQGSTRVVVADGDVLRVRCQNNSSVSATIANFAFDLQKVQ